MQYLYPAFGVVVVVLIVGWWLWTKRREADKTTPKSDDEPCLNDWQYAVTHIGNAEAKAEVRFPLGSLVGIRDSLHMSKDSLRRAVSRGLVPPGDALALIEMRYKTLEYLLEQWERDADIIRRKRLDVVNFE